MARQFAKLLCIKNNEAITKENNYEFIFHLQSAVLLALREQGRLNAMQHRRAEENLRKQRISRAKKLMKKGDRK